MSLAGLEPTSDAPPPGPSVEFRTKLNRWLSNPSFPLTITSYLDGPHFSYDHTSAFNYNIPVTPGSYQTLLTNEALASEINIGRNVSFFQPLVSLDSEMQKDPRHIVLSQDTSLVLEMDFTPGPDHDLAFNTLRIPFTRSVKYPGDPKGQLSPSFQILLVDTLTGMFVPIGRWAHEHDGDLSQSLVDFQAEESIIHLRDGKAVIRFKLPCCFLDSMHRTGCYRIRIFLELFGYRDRRTLPGTFEVAHMDEKLPEGNLQYLKEVATNEEIPHQPSHHYCCIAHNSHGKYHSDCNNIVDGCFERAFSLALRRNVIPLPRILASGDCRLILYSLSLEKRRRLKAAVQVEYRHLERVLTRARLDIAMLRREYELASYLWQLTAPIQRLPVELLTLTFSFIPGGENQKFGALMQTCRKWRDIVLSIWGPLRLTTWTSVEKVMTTLDRDIGPLSVTIDPSTDAMDSLITGPETERYAALVLALSTSTSRWRALKVLSLPDPQQTDRFFGEQSQVIGLLPLDLNQLRSLIIPIRHDPSRFLDLILPSISPMPSVQLTNMHLCSVQAILYFMQPHCAHVFNSLTSFKCSLGRVGDKIDILPHFWRLESLDVSDICFLTHGPGVELPLTKTLRHMSLRAASIDWMNGRKFPRLESCIIISPPASDVTPIPSLPLCMELRFEGPRFDTIENFHIPTVHTLTLCSPHWGKSRGNIQLFRFCGAMRNQGIVHLISLHLHLTCSSGLILQALCFMAELKELVLTLDRPTVLGRRFLIGLCPRSVLPQSTGSECGHKAAGKEEEQLDVCPSLEVLGLKYRRWFRSSESNDMLLLVAMVTAKREASREIKIWVEKGVPCQERVEVIDGRVSAFTLCSLGCLRLSDHTQVPSEAAEDITMASLALLNPSCPTFRHSQTITYLSPAVYPSLFPSLRISTLTAQLDNGILLDLIPRLEHLEQLHVPRLVFDFPMQGLSLFRTLKRMHLGETSLYWMTGCTFFRLEYCQIDRIDNAGFSSPRSIRMPACTSACISPSSVCVLDAFDFSQLRHLHLSVPRDGVNPSSRRWGEGLYALMRQFNLRSACFEGLDNPLVLRSALAVQNELEVLEIRHNKPITESDLSDLFDVLTGPNTMGTINTFDNTQVSPRSRRCNRDANRRLPLCPDLKTLKIKLGEIVPSEQPGMIHIAHRFMAPKKQKRRHLERCQLWWDKGAWDGVPSTQLTGSAQPGVAAAKVRSCGRDDPPATIQAVLSI